MTYFEDGREVPEVVGYLYGTPTGPYISRADYKGHPRDELMTVAQHERIVVGYITELGHLCALLNGTQPAHQVGGDERAKFNAWNNGADCPLAGRDTKTGAWMAWQARAALAPVASQVSGYRQDMQTFIELFAEHLLASGATNYLEDSFDLEFESVGKKCLVVVRLQHPDKPTPHELRMDAEARAALDPVAVVVSGYSGDPDTRGSKALKVIDLSTVNIGDKLFRSALAPAAVVMPERKDVTLATQDDDWPEVVSRRMAQAHNAALDEVARLNRRAIPVGLLERIQVELDDYHSMDLIGTHGCDDELRALLGKEGG